MYDKKEKNQNYIEKKKTISYRLYDVLTDTTIYWDKKITVLIVMLCMCWTKKHKKIPVRF